MTTIRPILKIPSRISTRIDCCQYTKRLSSSRAAIQDNHPKTTIAKKLYLQDSIAARSPPAARLIRALSTETGRVSWWEAGNLYGRDRNPNTSIIASTLYYDPYRSSCRMMSSTTLSSEKLQVGKNDEDDAQTDSSSSSSSSSSNNNFNDIVDIDKKDNSNYHIVTVKSQTKLTERKPNKQSFRSMLRQYGPVFIGTYGVVYVSTVFGLFMGVQSGILDATSVMDYLSGTASSTADAGGADVDPDIIQSAASTMTYMVEFLEYYSWTKPLAPIVQENPWTANFGIAWIMTKFTEPVRFGITVAVTPSIAKKLGYGPTAQNSPPSSQSPDADDDQSTSSSSSTEKN
jgi:hypothetical protein